MKGCFNHWAPLISPLGGSCCPGGFHTLPNWGVGAGGVFCIRQRWGAQHGHPVPLIPSFLAQVPKGGSVPPATEITKPPVVPQAQDRKTQVAYKTEIVGGVVVHTPISINQVSWFALSFLETVCCKPFPLQV